MMKLSKISTRAPQDVSKKEIKSKTKALVDRIGALQDMLHAGQKHSLLVVFQGMDASGKDGAARNIFKECHPSGISVYSFKKPTEEEFAHDFLWRVHKQVPRRGMIQIFNRSHYEDILIQRVHKWIDEDKVNNRMEAINAFEKLLTFDNHTTLLKFYLHISYEQQEIELKQRLDEQRKNWKHNDNDWKERTLWNDYMRCYEDAIDRSEIPWTIVPVDQRWYRDFVVASTIVDALEKLNMTYPKLDKTHKI